MDETDEIERTSPTSFGRPNGVSRRITDAERPKPEPLDDEVISLLGELWILTRKSQEQEANKAQIMEIWVHRLGSKMSLSSTKQALRYLIKTEEWWPAPVKFERAYNEIVGREGG